MSSVLYLLGLNYEQLGASEALRGAEIPERERIEDQSYVSIFPKGISFVLPNHMSVGAIQFHAAGHEGFLGYDQSLPFDLDFHMSREAVRQLLGNPNRSGEEGQILLLGKKPAWDSFDLDGFRVHVEYTFGAGSIQLVTIAKN